MRKKHIGTRISELLSTNIGFNKTWGKKHKLYFSSKGKYLELITALKLDVQIIDDTKMTSNLVYILKKKA